MSPPSPPPVTPPPGTSPSLPPVTSDDASSLAARNEDPKTPYRHEGASQATKNESFYRNFHAYAPDTTSVPDTSNALNPSSAPTAPDAPSIDPAEVAYFEALAHRWWDTEGPFWPLHKLNAFRVDYMRQRLCQAFGRDPAADLPLTGLRLLDIGCGGGILSESLAHLGAQVTGIDVAPKNIRVAELHAQGRGLDLDYRLTSAEALAQAGAQFDAVLNMEVVEHVENLPAFLAACGALVRPGGIMAVATINRTLAALVIAIFGAEYILRWLPKGTHHWRKLVKPAEVLAGLGDAFTLVHRTGVRVNPFDRRFHFTSYLGVNYLLLVQKQPKAP